MFVLELPKCAASRAKIFFREHMVLEKKIVKQTLIQSEDFFFSENTCFGDTNFRTYSHDDIILNISAIAAFDKLTDENLASDEQKIEHFCFKLINRFTVLGYFKTLVSKHSATFKTLGFKIYKIKFVSTKIKYFAVYKTKSHKTISRITFMKYFLRIWHFYR